MFNLQNYFIAPATICKKQLSYKVQQEHTVSEDEEVADDSK